MNRLLVISFLLFVFQVAAQTTEKYASKYANFYRAEDLYEKEQYGAARKEFRVFINQMQEKNDPLYVKALYYEGISALELFNNDAIPLLEDFNKNYPESIYKTQIYFKIARYYYQKKDYKNALVWLDQLKPFDIDADAKDEYYFKVGYAHFHEGNKTIARNAFYEIKDGSSQYASPSLYYFSHISYEEKSYQVALEGFEKLMSDPKFKSLVPYYIAQIYYLQGRYEDITKFAPSFVDSVGENNQSSMNHLIGDAFFKTNKFDEAVPFLEAYDKTAKTTRIEDYQLAYAYYRSASYPKAIQLFDRVAQTKDSIAQIAFYHIAECYLRQGNNSYARKAFEAASFLTFDPKIQEDALYNYAILSYKLDINPYDEAVEALQLYLTKYPNSDRKNEVYQYLVNVYTSINNYASALNSLDKLPNKDFQLKAAYQLVAFNYGVELYQKSDFPKSIEAFKKVDTYPMDLELSARAKYWIADNYYQLKQYDRAVNNYREFISQPGTTNSGLKSDAYYNIAYSYLTNKDYSQAIDGFRSYLQQADLKNLRKKTDAQMRLADCYFAMKKDELAIQYYKDVVAVKSDYQDQALYYLAKSYQYTGKSLERIKCLQDIVNNYPKSRYLETSILETAFEYRFLEQDEKALPYFQQIERDYPSSLLLKDALLNIADIYFKKRDFVKSENYYTLVLAKFESDRAVCSNAVNGIVAIYKAQKKPERIQELIGKYECSDFTQDEQEEIFYNSAIEPYLDSAFVEAIPQLTKYLNKFPKGKYKVEIDAYLANSYYRTGDLQKALETYERVFEVGNSDFVELAALRLSREAYNNGDFENALRYYTKLESISSQAAVINNTRIGMMRTHFILEHWSDASQYAKKVLLIAQLSNTTKLEAEYIKGISLYHSEQFEEAIPTLEWVVKNANNQFAPEAKYSIADAYYKQNNLVKAEAEIKALLKMKPAYDYWIAKGLILQTHILIAKNDLFQAEHTLKSVIDNYPDKEDGILIEANQLWDELMQLKNKPKNVKENVPTDIEIQENGK